MDQLLLHAALSPAERAITAWREWYTATQLEGMNEASYRLLPLVHAHLIECGYDGAELGRIKGIRRKLWLEGERRMYLATPFLRDLQERFGPLVLLKGAPLAALYYRDFGMRGMSDVDVLIPEEGALAVIRSMREQGWEMEIYPQPARIDEEFLTFRHGAGFRHANGVELDLHWRLSYLRVRPGVDAPVRAAVEPFLIHGFSCWTLCATDHFFHTLIHGVLYNPAPASRWVADAIQILKSGRPVDFARLEELTRHYQVGPYVKAALDYLAERFGVETPAIHLDPPGMLLRLEYQRETMDWFASAPHVTVASTVNRYRQTGASLGNLPRFARYCRYQWDLTTKAGLKAKIQRVLG